MPEMTSPKKIAYHRERMEAYLNGRPIHPTSIELDITTRCPRGCHECPSTLRPEGVSLGLPFFERLFSFLEGQTRGLLISGGEPTISPIFPEVLRLARKKGITEIAVVTNGSLLQDDRVADALAEHATAVRISLYDWDEELQGRTGGMLRRIESLRDRLEKNGSRLAIGVSALTTHSRVRQLGRVAGAARSAGAHWIYFHPLCEGWNSSHLRQEDQDGVVRELTALQQAARNGFGIHFCRQRYEHHELRFEQYHSAHFLLVLGADGKNYLGTEVKYQPEYVLADLSGHKWRDDFLGQSARLERIREFSHRNYPPQGGRHRAVLYNHYLQQLIDGLEPLDEAAPQADAFLYPHIL